MNKETDIAILNLSDSEDLATYLADKNPGDEISMTVRGKLLGVEDENARITIEDVQVDAYMEEEDEPEVEPGLTDMETDGPAGVELVL